MNNKENRAWAKFANGVVPFLFLIVKNVSNRQSVWIIEDQGGGWEINAVSREVVFVLLLVVFKHRDPNTRYHGVHTHVNTVFRSLMVPPSSGEPSFLNVVFLSWINAVRSSSKDFGAAGDGLAKAAVVDRKALIISANLTDDAFLRNLELGVLFVGGDMPSKLREHFENLMVAGTLLRWTQQVL